MFTPTPVRGMRGSLFVIIVLWQLKMHKLKEKRRYCLQILTASEKCFLAPLKWELCTIFCETLKVFAICDKWIFALRDELKIWPNIRILCIGILTFWRAAKIWIVFFTCILLACQFMFVATCFDVIILYKTPKWVMLSSCIFGIKLLSKRSKYGPRVRKRSQRTFCIRGREEQLRLWSFHNVFIINKPHQLGYEMLGQQCREDSWRTLKVPKPLQMDVFSTNSRCPRPAISFRNETASLFSKSCSCFLDSSRIRMESCCQLLDTAFCSLWPACQFQKLLQPLKKLEYFSKKRRYCYQ